MSVLGISFVLQLKEKPPESLSHFCHLRALLPEQRDFLSLSPGYCPLEMVSYLGDIGIAANHRNAPFPK